MKKTYIKSVDDLENAMEKINGGFKDMQKGLKEAYLIWIEISPDDSELLDFGDNWDELVSVSNTIYEALESVVKSHS